MMRDASYLEGKVVRAEPEEILIHVKKSDIRGSAVKIHNNNAILRTSDIGSVYIRESGSAAAPVVLGIIGGALGVIGTVNTLEDSRCSAAAAWTILIGLTAGGATGGALLGREVSKKIVTVNVISGDD